MRLPGQRNTGLQLLPGVARGPTGVIKSILDTSRTAGGRRDEIFVDIVEKISCTFNAAGSIQTSQIDGSVQVLCTLCLLCLLCCAPALPALLKSSGQDVMFRGLKVAG